MGSTSDDRYGKGSRQRGFTLGVLLWFLSMGVVGRSATLAGAARSAPGAGGAESTAGADRMQIEQDRQRVEQLERQGGSVEAKSEQKSKELEEKITKQAQSQPRMPRRFAYSCGHPTEAEERMFTNGGEVSETLEY